MPSVKRDSVTSSFPISTPLISFSSLIALPRVSCTQGVEDSGKPCQILDFKGNASDFSLLAVGLLHIALITLKNVHSSPVPSRTLNIKACCILSKAFSTSIEMTM